LYGKCIVVDSALLAFNVKYSFIVHVFPDPVQTVPIINQVVYLFRLSI